MVWVGWENLHKTNARRFRIGIYSFFCTMPALNFSLVQTRLHWEDKRANLQMLESKILGLQEATQVVVLPEMFSTGFSMRPELLAEDMEGATVQWMRKIAAQKKIILTGSLIVADKGQYFNRMVWMLPNGQYGHYDKRHLFGYAGEDKHYASGSKRLIASVNGWRINLMVCYDLRFPVWSRQSPPPSGDGGETEYDVLVYVANWPEKRNTAWKALLQARAIENQCYVIGVNRVGQDGNGIDHCGDSMVIGPLGEILYHKVHEEDLATIGLDREHLQQVRERFPFLRDADHFEIML
jgi:omega-amidase